MEAQYSAFWISKVLFPTSHEVMFGLENLTSTQVKNFLQAVFANAQGMQANLNQTLCGVSVQAATDIFLDFQQNMQNFHRFIVGSPLLFFLFIILFAQYEKTVESRSTGTRESSVIRARKFVSCLQASLFSLPSSENLKASNVKGSFYTLMTALTQKGILSVLDSLTPYPTDALNSSRSKQVIQMFFDNAQFPNANDFLPRKSETPNVQSSNTSNQGQSTSSSQPNRTPPQSQVQVSTTTSLPTNVVVDAMNRNLLPASSMESSVFLPTNSQSGTQTQTPQTQTPQTQTPQTQTPQTQTPQTQTPQISTSQVSTAKVSKSKSHSKVKGLALGLAAVGLSVLGYILYQKSKND